MHCCRPFERRTGSREEGLRCDRSEQATLSLAKETQGQHEAHRTDETRDEDPPLQWRIENDLAAARLLGRVRLFRLRSRLCWAFSDHASGPRCTFLRHVLGARSWNAARLRKFLEGGNLADLSD